MQVSVEGDIHLFLCVIILEKLISFDSRTYDIKNRYQIMIFVVTCFAVTANIDVSCIHILLQQLSAFIHDNHSKLAYLMSLFVEKVAGKCILCLLFYLMVQDDDDI